MSDSSPPFLNDQLSRRTSIFGLHLWAVVGICVGAAFVLLLFLISLWFTSKHRTRTTTTTPQAPKPTIPNICKEIQEVRIDPPLKTHQDPIKTQNHETDPAERQLLLLLPPGEEESQSGLSRINIEIGKDHRILYPGGSSSGESRLTADQAQIAAPEVSHLGWGHWYTLRELEAATNGFVDENVIGEGGYGIVYHGLLEDNTQVAVKNLLNNRGQAEREFKVEVEAIGRVRHKNLVRLLGYCAEGAHRMLVYEYVDNGNLEQWLHGDVGPCSPLTWDIRMNIILGTAKGLMYLHEGLEPKVVHRDIKSSNILLDKQWNSKVSDFGLAKLLGSERSYVTTRVMGTFGSVNLVEWLKTMVGHRNSEGVLDPKMTEKPTSRALKKALLVALRCVDPDSQKRPKMGHVIHMLEVDDFPYRDASKSPKGVNPRLCNERKTGRDLGHIHREGPLEKARLLDKRVVESGDSSGYDSGAPVSRNRLRDQEA
ncbi:putative serine/threonine-protein kinase [Acorus gramineus]|uniref:non-specific serine/threonine protein kinase n=1 Tax=Acorus gramineus TaxID=55184 RepID=A0AAV9BFH2_ACOGR|nr:putative serine/threonine-protein kinase [Acorus gramineus]